MKCFCFAFKVQILPEIHCSCLQKFIYFQFQFRSEETKWLLPSSPLYSILKSDLDFSSISINVVRTIVEVFQFSSDSTGKHSYTDDDWILLQSQYQWSSVFTMRAAQTLSLQSTKCCNIPQSSVSNTSSEHWVKNSKDRRAQCRWVYQQISSQ